MPFETFMIYLFGIGSLITILSLIIVLTLKMERVKQLQAMVDQLKKSLDEMDEQAKLIVRTDIELNKTQEELDKKITGLYSLQKLSRAVATSLEEAQIFKMIKAESLEGLGFEKACGFLWDEKEKKFDIHLTIGYSPEEANLIKSQVDADKEFYLGLILQRKTASSISISDNAFKTKLNNIFKIISFVISPIVPKEGLQGFLFVGTESADMALSEGDEELITILVNQISTALENARLFEKTWMAQQELEKNVEERTQELKQALEEVKTASKRKTDFISAVSHELRTPLTSIKGYASILLTGKLGAVPVDVHARLEKINRHSDELTNLVNDLLDISRIESGKMIMKRQPQSLNNIFAEIADLLSVQLKEKQIELSCKIEKDATVVQADLGQLKRVFINLVGNAIKFVPLKEGKIVITAKKIDNFVQIDVIDNGCGIPDEAKEKIFEEFYRVENSINEQVKGTGLGLSLVKNIIQAHGGKIWVTSKAGMGSTFSFTLPL